MSGGQEELFGRKIRESCNACSTQKIRCSKERPQCGRCSNKDIACNYSPSLRTGRHPRAAAQVQIDGQHISSDARLHTQQPPLSSRSEHRVTHNDDGIRLGESVPWNECLVHFGANPEPTDTAAASSSTHLDACGWPDADQDPLVGSSRAFGSSPDNSVQPAYCPQYIQETSIFACPSQLDCYATLLRLAVEQLHDPSQTCILVGGQRKQQRRHHARNIDTILSQNREAMRTLTRSLDCSCMMRWSVKLAAYMVAYEIISYYGALVGDSGRFLESVGGHIIDSPVYIGSYALDAGACRAIRARAVLNELENNVRPVLDKLPCFDARYGRGGLSVATTSVVSRSKAAEDGCCLRAQLQRVIAAASETGLLM